MEGEDLVQRNAEASGDPEGQFQRREILAVLDGKDGLAGDACAVGKLFLRHLARLETQAADAVLDTSDRLGHASGPAPVQEKFGNVPEHL